MLLGKLNKILFIAIFIVISTLTKIISAAPIERIPIMSCVLNKSFTLEIYQQSLDEQEYLIIENKSFLESIGQGEKLLNLDLKQLSKIEYGNVLMYTVNLGRSGYFFLRIDKNLKPSDTDLGNATLRYDNSLFLSRDHWFYTDGHLVQQPDCTYLQ